MCIVTGMRFTSENGKTGEGDDAKWDRMAQVYILPADMPSHEAYWLQSSDIAHARAFRAVCGDCEIGKAKACYVRKEQSVLSTWSSWRAGNKVRATKQVWDWLASGAIAVRIGADGDPAAVPAYVWERICRPGARWTGYCHQWRDARFQVLSQWLMASTSDPDSASLAMSMGWRAFHVVSGDESPEAYAGTVLCPSDTVVCARCGLCDGQNTQAKSVRIVAHGAHASKLITASRLSRGKDIANA